MLFYSPYYSPNYNGGFAEQSYDILCLSFTLCKTASAASATSETTLTETHTSVINNIYKICFFGEKTDCFQVLQHEFSYHRCRMLQPRTKLHIVKTEISGELVTDDFVRVAKKNQSCSLVLSMAYLLLKCWTVAKGFWVQFPTRSVIFSLIKK